MSSPKNSNYILFPSRPFLLVSKPDKHQCYPVKSYYSVRYLLKTQSKIYPHTHPTVAQDKPNHDLRALIEDILFKGHLEYQGHSRDMSRCGL